MLLQKLKINKIAIAIALTAIATTAQAGYKIKISDQDTIEFGGYIKADARYVDGTVPFADYWIGGGATGPDASQFKLHARETRFNTKYTHGEVMAFLELDFSSPSVGGNEVISNSYSPRLRHAFIKYKNWMIGQTWSTFMNTSAIPESADFGGPIVGEVFVRQGQIRYTNGGLQLAIENPQSWGGTDSTNDNLPDVIAKYSFKGDWGSVSVAGLVRQLEPKGIDKTAVGASVTGRIKTVGKDDFRFQLHHGDLGRYVGATITKDIVGGKVEETTAYTVAYRHFWNNELRSTIYYGHAEGELAKTERSHFAVNLFKSLTKNLSVGVEFGNYDVSDAGVEADSNYLQLSAKFVL
ncbi:MAG: hypothetical protein HRU24_06290 [Gammaproteobacteria bacterium]|nr:hypothetical protein [Gammaproteobacteria bacterium]